LLSPGNNNFQFRLFSHQILTSFITFSLGASLGRIGDRIGAKTRLWLFLGTLLQSFFTVAASLTVWKCDQLSINISRDNPNWTHPLGFAGIGFMSASLGLQGIMATRLNSQFADSGKPLLHVCCQSSFLIESFTVVLTVLLCELMSDPDAFSVKHVESRDYKTISIFSFFLGGFVSRAIIDKVLFLPYLSYHSSC
jgi:hypothetical protein